MSDYVLLYSGGARMPETEEEQAQVLQAWNDWFQRVGQALKDGGNPFTATAVTVESDGTVSDGPTGSIPTGYTVVEADSMDDVIDFARSSPVLDNGGSVTVFETYETM
jgi:hypothetical protein